MAPTTPSPRHQIVGQLKSQLRRLEKGSALGESVLQSGWQTLDGLLPGGGFRRGKLVEWLHATEASGAGTLSLLAAQTISQGGTLVVIDGVRDGVRDGEFHDGEFHGGGKSTNFYPPAAAAWGIDLKNLVLVRPQRQADVMWARDQVLRCEAVSAAWGRVDRLDENSFRRWQLATENSGAVGFLLRSATMRGQPSWSDVQLLVEPVGQPRATPQKRCLRVEIVRCRGAAAGRAVELELDESAPL